MEALWELSLVAPGHVTAILQAENWQKVNEFEPVYLRKYQLMKQRLWVMKTLLTTFSWLC